MDKTEIVGKQEAAISTITYREVLPGSFFVYESYVYRKSDDGYAYPFNNYGSWHYKAFNSVTRVQPIKRIEITWFV